MPRWRRASARACASARAELRAHANSGSDPVLASGELVAEGRDDRVARRAEGLGAAQRAGEDEGALERAEEEQGQLARAPGLDAVVDEADGGAGDPGVEDLRARLAHGLADRRD